jgi:tetratricopeptide (TPR) repeat protein
LIGIFIAFVWGTVEWMAVEKFQIPSSKLQTSTKSQAPNFGSNSRAVDLALRWLAVGIGVALLVGTSLQLRHWKNTRTLFEHAAAVTHNNGRAITVLGSLLAKDGKLEEAMNLYRQALRYKPHDPEAHFFMGHALEQQGKLDEAVAEYSQALWFKPLQEKTHLFLGVALAKQQKYAEAAAHYQAVLAINPESAAAQNNLARLLQTQGRLDEAIERYSAALKLDPNLAQAHNNLGVLLLQKGRLAEGIAQLREAVRLRPADFESLSNLALALNQQQNWKEAAEIFGRIEAGMANDPRLHYQFGLALAYLGKPREAMSSYARALLLQPDFPDALDRLSWILATDPRPEFRNGTEAVRMAERACELTGYKQALLLATLAAAYGETGRFQEAAVTAEKAGEIAKISGQNEMAIKCRSILEELNNGNPWREQRSETP